MMIQALLFDADGVVIHPFRFAAYLERRHGLTREATADFFAGPFRECLSGQADLKQALAPYLARWGWPATVDAFIERWMLEDDAPDQRVLALVDDLRSRGMACYLATNQERYRLDYMRKRMGFAQRFDGIFASAELGALKPDYTFFAAVTSRLGLPRERLLFWDDSAENVAVARAYGWYAEQYGAFAEFARRIEQLFGKRK